MYRKQGEAILSHSEYLEQRKATRHQNTEFERKKKLYLLIGGRSGRISLHKDPATGQLIQVIDDESVPPALELAYDFLSDPTSSFPATLWSWGLVVVILTRFMQLSLLTLDGPHFYDDANKSTYKFLPGEAGHEAMFIACGIPLLLDSTIRIVFFAVVFADNQSEVCKRLVEDKPFQILTVLSILGMIPIFVAFATDTLLFESTSLSEIVRIILRLLTVCIMVHLYRHVRHYSLIKVVVRSIHGAAGHLVLPVMTFLMVNITFGVIFYFFEPCFSEHECHWHDLLEATTFVVVTTTTTGYGNQYPQLHGMKILGVVVMLFGSLYLSMPLALIGNEYVEVLKELEVEDGNDRKAMYEKMAAIKALRSIYSMEIDDLLLLTESSVPLTEEEETMENVRKHHLIVSTNKTLGLCKLFVEHAATNKSLTPNLVLIFVEIKATMEPLHAYLKALMQEISTTWISAHAELDARDTLLKQLEAKAELAVVKVYDSSSEEETDSSDESDSDDEERKRNDDDDSESSSSSSDDEGGEHHTTGAEGMTEDVRKMLANMHGGGGGGEHDGGLQDDPKVLDIHSRDLREKEGPSLWVRIEKTLRQAWHAVRSVEKKGFSRSYNHSWNAKVERLLSAERLTEKERLWMMFNLPRSSREAGALEVFITICVIFSMIVFFMESDPNFSNYGETTVICGDVMRNYCLDKDYRSDPGCFVQAPDGIGATTTPLKFPESIYLGAKDLVDQKDCYSSYSGSSYYEAASNTFAYGNYTYTAGSDGSDIVVTQPLNECFGNGYNFGTTQVIDKTTEYVYKYKELTTETNVTCLSDSTGSLVFPDKMGFQSQQELDLHYGTVVEAKERDKLHSRYAICTRPECAGVPAADDQHTFFAISEIALGTVFTLDLVMRVNLVDTYMEIFLDKMLYIDFLALLPFYVTVIQQYNFGTYVKTITDLDFSIMASSPKPYIVTFAGITKLLRGFKLTRVFKASQVLVHTAKNVSTQLFAMLGMFTLILFCFSIFFFELERGKPCYVGDDDCPIPPKAPNGLKDGDRIYVDKNGDYSAFTSILDTFWFCFVSSTTVGYGDKYPATNQGKVLNFVLMLFGAVYMVFPLTVASTTFYSAYSKYLMSRQKQEEDDRADDNMKIKIFTSNALYPNGFSDSVQQSLQFVLNRLKQSNMEIMQLQTDLFADEFSKHHQDHLKQRAEREGAKGGEDKGDRKSKKPFEKEEKSKKAAKSELENVEEGDEKEGEDKKEEPGEEKDEEEEPDPEADQGGLLGMMGAEGRLSLEREWKKADEERRKQLKNLLADHSSLVARMYVVADGLRVLIEANMGRLEALAYFSSEADAFNTNAARESLAKNKDAWRHAKRA